MIFGWLHPPLLVSVVLDRDGGSSVVLLVGRGADVAPAKGKEIEGCRGGGHRWYDSVDAFQTRRSDGEGDGSK
jgi:hypothetical protein